MAIYKRVYWNVCSPSCTTYSVDPNGTQVIDWGTAVAGFGDKYRLYEYKVSPQLYLVNDNDPENVIETLIDTYTHKIEMYTAQTDQMSPNIELYDAPPDVTGVAGIIDGTYYVYPVVFQDAQFCYLPACSTARGLGETCLAGTGTFPIEPYIPDCPSGPIYPMDSITAFVPSQQTEVLMRYTATWTYSEGDDGTGTQLTNAITLDQTVLAPSQDWHAAMIQMMEYTYFYNGIYH